MIISRSSALSVNVLLVLDMHDLFGALFLKAIILSVHGTIIRTGITCKKISCYMPDSAYGWFIVKKAKIFCGYVKHS